ncbi:MAG: hypothetical protein Q9216_004282 [Gyalolechia sp. 2 TL-2023]
MNVLEQEFLQSLGDLNGKVAIVTGNREKCLRGIARAEETLPETRGSIKFHQLDLSSIKGAKWSAQEFLKLEDRLDIVVANAGVSMLNLNELSQDGYERISIFPLTRVVDLIKQTSLTHGDARIVVTSSIGYQSATGLDYSSLTTARPGDGDSVWDVKPAFVRYGNSKLANIYFVNELAKRLLGDGFKNVFCNSCHPGSPTGYSWTILGAGLVVDAKIYSMPTGGIDEFGQGPGRTKEALGLQRARRAGQLRAVSVKIHEF